MAAMAAASCGRPSFHASAALAALAAVLATSGVADASLGTKEGRKLMLGGLASPMNGQLYVDPPEEQLRRGAGSPRALLTSGQGPWPLDVVPAHNDIADPGVLHWAVASTGGFMLVAFVCLASVISDCTWGRQLKVLKNGFFCRRQLQDYVLEYVAQWSSQQPAPGRLEEEQPVAVPKEFGKVLSVREATFILTAMLFSTQAFLGPHALALSGLWGGLAALAVSWSVNLGTGLLLGEVLHKAQGLGPGAETTYEDVGRLAFGPAFGHISAFFCLGELFLYGVWWAVSFGINLPLLAQRVGFHLPPWVAVTATTSLTVINTLIPGKSMSYISLTAVFVLLSCAVMMMASVFLLPEVANDQQGFIASGLGPSFSAFTFGFAAHATFPSTFSMVQEPRKESYKQALTGAFMATLLGTGVLSVVVYWGFGRASEPLCTANLGRDTQGHLLPQNWAAALQLVALACFSFKSLSSWPLCMRPLGNFLARKIGCEMPAGVKDEAELLLIDPRLCLTRFLCNCVMGLGCGLLGALLAERIRLVTELTAAIFMGMNAFVFPAICFLKLAPDAGTLQRTLAQGAGLLGLGLMLSPLHMLFD